MMLSYGESVAHYRHNKLNEISPVRSLCRALDL